MVKGSRDFKAVQWKIAGDKIWGRYKTESLGIT